MHLDGTVSTRRAAAPLVLSPGRSGPRERTRAAAPASKQQRGLRLVALVAAVLLVVEAVGKGEA
jgi:hypothetical protein